MYILKLNSPILILLLGLSFFTKAQTPDWSTSIAGIFYENCTTCHHEGGIAPFSLITYEVAVDNGFNIQTDVNTKKMPPWPADPTVNHFWDEKVLTDEEITAINDWVNNGMPAGDLSLAPVPPVYSGNSTMLNPDDTVQLPVYTIPNDSDNYRTFVVYSNFTEFKYINAIEFIPGNNSVVHHASFHHDTSDASYQQDLADPLPGYATDDFGDPSSTAINFGAWLPGNGIFKLLPNMGFKIPPNSYFVISIHYAPGNGNQKDSSKLYFKYTDMPDSLIRVVYKSKWLFPSVLVNGPLNIPANSIKTFNEISQPLTHKSLLGVVPHSHHVCTSWKVQMVTSTGDTTNLISIPKWSFYWQYNYMLTKVMDVPGLAQMLGEAVFDNTVNNPDNPNDPPKAVHEGGKSTNEMMNCGFILMDYEDGDENIILDSAFYGLPTADFSLSAEMPFELYPNPVSDEFHFITQLETHDVNWKLINLYGAVVKQSNRNYVPKGVYVQDVDVTELGTGIYQFYFQSGNKVVVKKILVVK